MSSCLPLNYFPLTTAVKGWDLKNCNCAVRTAARLPQLVALVATAAFETFLLLFKFPINSVYSLCHRDVEPIHPPQNSPAGNAPPAQTLEGLAIEIARDREETNRIIDGLQNTVTKQGLQIEQNDRALSKQIQSVIDSQVIFKLSIEKEIETLTKEENFQKAQERIKQLEQLLPKETPSPKNDVSSVSSNSQATTSSPTLHLEANEEDNEPLFLDIAKGKDPVSPILPPTALPPKDKSVSSYFSLPSATSNITAPSLQIMDDSANDSNSSLLPIKSPSSENGSSSNSLSLLPTTSSSLTSPVKEEEFSSDENDSCVEDKKDSLDVKKEIPLNPPNKKDVTPEGKKEVKEEEEDGWEIGSDFLILPSGNTEPNDSSNSSSSEGEEEKKKNLAS